MFNDFDLYFATSLTNSIPKGYNTENDTGYFLYKIWGLSFLIVNLVVIVAAFIHTVFSMTGATNLFLLFIFLKFWIAVNVNRDAKIPLSALYRK